MKTSLSRRQFLQTSLSAGAAVAIFRNMPSFSYAAASGMKFGLVTYQWGKDWDLPTLISNCQKAGIKGVELRTQHAHKVEADLTAAQRAEVKKSFADSGITCVGYGSNYEFHNPDQKILRDNIEQAKIYVKLCKDIGATGLKVKPNGLPANVEKEKTIAQIAASLNELGKYARDFGQLIRVECHGSITQEIPNMKAIFEQVTEKNVKMCWNSNVTDLNGDGLVANFNSVKKWLGDTTHVRELDSKDYPFSELMNLFAGMNYKGWILLEASRTPFPSDIIEGMKGQLALFNQMTANKKK